MAQNKKQSQSEEQLQESPVGSKTVEEVRGGTIHCSTWNASVIVITIVKANFI